MFSLRLNAKDCISCGICMDVCALQAITMRVKWSRSIEGSRLTYLHLRSYSNNEVAPAPMGTFPYLSDPVRCDGCGRCVAECPTLALKLQSGYDSASAILTASSTTT